MSDDLETPQILQRAEGSDEGEATIDSEDIDLQALAREVYVLLRRELWIERERRGWRRIW